MRTLAIFLIICVGIAVAYPSWSKSRADDDDDEGNYGRNRLVSHSRRSSPSSGPGPYYFSRGLDQSLVMTFWSETRDDFFHNFLRHHRRLLEIYSLSLIHISEPT